MIIGEVDNAYTREWALTSEQPHGKSVLSHTNPFVQTMFEVQTYVADLQMRSATGLATNWVKVDYVWM